MWDSCVGGRQYFPYYSYRGKATEQDFFIPARTLIWVILFNKSATCKSQEEPIDLTEMNEKSPRENAIKKKNQQQAINAVKSIKWRGKTAIKAGASPGAVVSLKVDY